jgi:hypothetical protein
VALQHIGRHENLPSGGVPREGAQKAGERVGDARLTGLRREARIGAVGEDEAA